MTNYIERVNTLLEELYLDYKSKPYYLKETLRQIKSLVHQANLQADNLIVKEWFKNFDSKDTIDTLTKEFPKLNWEEEAGDKEYIATGTLGKLVVSVSYRINFIDSIIKPSKKVEPYWVLDIYLNDNESCIELYNSIDISFNSLQSVVNEIKQTLRPLVDLFNKWEIT